MENSNHLIQSSTLQLTKMDSSTDLSTATTKNEKLDQQQQPNIADLLEKISTCMPLLNQVASSSAPSSSMTASNSDSTVVQDSSAPTAVLNSVFEQFQKFHETLLTEKLDNFKSQKGELEELKEKIMKLEQRNSELEKKLSVNANQSSKENSFNESFSLQTDDQSLTNTSTTTTTTNQKNDLNAKLNNFMFSNNDLTSNTNLFQANNTNTNAATSSNLIFQNKLNLLTQTNTAPLVTQSSTGTNLQSSLNTIPNINQGGFIITHNGIAFLPPMPSNIQSSTSSSKPTSSTNPSSSTTNINDSPFKQQSSLITNESSITNGLFDDHLKLDFDSTFTSNSKNSANLDLNSILNKNLFNSLNTNIKSNQTSPNSSNIILPGLKTTSPSKTNSTQLQSSNQQQTAFILSNGQLLPVISSGTNVTTPLVATTASSLSPLSNPLILPSSNVVNIQPKPQSNAVSSTSTPITLTKKPKQKVKTTKSTKNNKKDDETTNKQIAVNLTSPQPNSTPTTNSSNTNPATILSSPQSTNVNNQLLKHRAIRPKPTATSSNSTSTPLINLSSFNANNTNKSQLIVLPASALPPNSLTTATNSANGVASTNKLNYGIIKINTLGTSTSQQMASPKTVNNIDINNFNPILTSTSGSTTNTNGLVNETNDILSKAASMIFSPSEFSLNNLSPNTTTTTTNPTSNNQITLSPNSALNNAIVNFQASDSQLLLSTIAPAIASSTLTSNKTNNKVNKIPIQRNHSQNSMQPLNCKPIMPKPDSTSSLTTSATANSNTTKANKNKSSNNSKTKKQSKLPNSSSFETNVNNSTNKPNKIALPPLNKSNKTKTAESTNILQNATNENSDPVVVLNGGILNLKNIFVTSDLSVQQTDLSKLNEPVVTINDFLLNNSNISTNLANTTNSIDQVLKQQELSDLQIQLQLQSLFSNNNNIVFNNPVLENSKSVDKKEETIIIKVSDEKKERSKSPDLTLSMPSLEQFFEIEPTDPSITVSTNTTVTKSVNKNSAKSVKTKSNENETKEKTNDTKKQTEKKLINKKVDEAMKPDHKSKSQTIKSKESPTKTGSNSTKNIRPKDIKPKTIETATTHSNDKTVNEVIPEKIKFVLTDLDKVLEQVESISNEPSKEITNTKSNKSNDFIFELLNSEAEASNNDKSFNSDFKLNTFTINSSEIEEKPTKKETNKLNKHLKIIDNDKSVLSTPPSLITSNMNKSTAKKKSKNVQQEQKNLKNTTPVKMSSLDDDDLFAFLNVDEHREPLKPDNHQINAVKKRGRPPKALTDTKSVKISTKSTKNNYELNNSTDTLNESDLNVDESRKKTKSREILSSSENEYEDEENSNNILNAAVANTFQELIDKESIRTPLDQQINRANEQNYQNEIEVEDFNNFVYDIAIDTENTATTNNQTHEDNANFDLNRIIDGNNQQEITIASLTMQKRKRSKQIDNTKKTKSTSKETINKTNDKTKAKKKRRRSASLCDDEDEYDENDDESNEEESENESDTEANKSYEQLDSKKDDASIATIAALSGNSNEKRKRGRPPKPSNESIKETANNEIGEFFGSKTKPNYKKINNPCGTTSILALNTNSTSNNIEIAGLTRFEIPFELGNDSNDTSKDNNNIDDACSKNKIPKISDTNFKTNDLLLPSTEILDEKKKSKETNFQTVKEAKIGSTKSKEELNDSQSDLIEKEDNDNDKLQENLILDNLEEKNDDLGFSNQNKLEEDVTIKSIDENNKMIYDQINYETSQIQNTNSNNKSEITQSYWNSYSTNTNESNPNHVSHLDLENDPILNNDLQKLHNEQQIQKSHLMNQSGANTQNLIITPPSTVSSVCSTSSSSSNNINSSNIYNNNNSNSSNSLSINPSSTSSNSSTQMISPVNSINSISDNMNNNNSNRSSSVDPLQYNNNQNSNYYSSYQMSNNNTNQFQYNNTNSSNKYGYNNETSSQNLNITQTNLNRNSNSSPQLVNPIYNTNNNNAVNNNINSNPRSNSVAPTPPLPQQTNQHILNTSQSPHHRHSTSLSSTPTPAPTTPTPTPSTPTNSYSYNNQTNVQQIQHITPPNLVSSNTNTTRQDSTKSTKLPHSNSIESNMYQPFSYAANYANQPNIKSNFETNYQNTSTSQHSAVMQAVSMFQNHTNPNASSYSFPNPTPNASFPSLTNRTDYNSINFNHLNTNHTNNGIVQNQNPAQHYDSTSSTYLPNSTAATSLNHSFLMNNQSHLNHANANRLISNFNPLLDMNKTNAKVAKTNELQSQVNSTNTIKKSSTSNSSKPKKQTKQSSSMPVTTPITPPSSGPVITPITPSTTPTPSTNTNLSHNNYNGYAMPNWYDIFQKQQAENVSSYNKTTSDYYAANPNLNSVNNTTNWNNTNNSVNRLLNQAATTQIDHNRQFNNNQIIVNQYNSNQLASSNFFHSASTKQSMKSNVSQEDLNSNQSRSYQHNQLNSSNANTNYLKQTSMQRSSSNNSMIPNGTGIDNYQRLNQANSIANTHNNAYSQQYAINQSQTSSTHNSFANNYSNQFNTNHNSLTNNSINNGLQNNTINHAHHLNPAAAVAAAMSGGFPHPAAAMSSILAATNQFSNVSQFNPWN